MISTTEQPNCSGFRQSNRSESVAAAQNSTATAAAVLDLCSGLGGLSLAAKELGLRVVAGVDVNKDALKTFSKNFPTAEALEGSVRRRPYSHGVKNCWSLSKPQNSRRMILQGLVPGLFCRWHPGTPLTLEIKCSSRWPVPFPNWNRRAPSLKMFPWFLRTSTATGLIVLRNFERRWVSCHKRHS